MDKKALTMFATGKPALDAEDLKRIENHEKEFMVISVDRLLPGKYQPRKDFSDKKIEGLTKSMRTNGLINTLVVRALSSEPGKYEILCGERRWLAAINLGWKEIKCRIRYVDDQTAASISLIDNVNREDLNAMEEAFGMIEYKEKFSLTDEDIALEIGKSRSQVTNIMRLIDLDETVRSHILNGSLTMGGGRAMLALPADEQVKLSKMAIDEKWSVRAIETYCKNYNMENSQREYEDRVSAYEQHFVKKHKIRSNTKVKKNGNIEFILTFEDAAQFEALLDKLM